mgnify:FL=1
MLILFIIPIFMTMKIAVFRSIHYLQIFYSVIFSIMIYVMDMLIRSKFSTNMFFHKKTMFLHMMTIYKQLNIWLDCFTMNPIRIALLKKSYFFAFLRTKMSFMWCNSRWDSIVNFFTYFTRKFNFSNLFNIFAFHGTKNSINIIGIKNGFTLFTNTRINRPPSCFVEYC